jgi:transposase
MFSFTGWRLEEITFSLDVVQVNLARDRRRRLRCPDCGRKVVGSHEQIRTARDMPLGPATLTLIRYPAVRARCGCGWASWLGPPEIDTRRKATYRMLRQAVRLARDLPLRKAAALLGIGATRLRRWDKAMLAEHLQRPDLDAVRFLLVDEKAVGRGHDYVTVVLNAETGELLHCHEGRKKASLQSFFETLTDAQKANVQAVCVDRSGAYVECVQEQVPAAAICYDRFHLVKNFNHIVDLVRREEWNRARRDKDDRTAKLIKGQRYNLLRRGEKNSTRQQSRLEELLAMNQRLSKAYLLLEDFREALGEKHVGHAVRALTVWVETALESGIDKVKAFARRMQEAAERIVNAIRYQLNNGRLEGFNNLIARILHRGCGYHDADYLLLKLRQAALPAELQVPVFQK